VSNISAGKMRGLGITSAKRVPALADVPTMIESGFPGFELVVYSGILAPAGTPKPIVDKLHAEFVKAVQSDDVKQAFARIGAEPMTMSPTELRSMMQRDIERLAPIVKASGATID
jgi:tripartite-type tricarboxylate transporter receptor subunit TctC